MDASGREPRRLAHLRAARLPFIVAAVAVGLGLLLPRPVASSASTIPLASSAPVNARPVYLADCAVCHGYDGRGTQRGISLFGQGRAAVDYALTTGRMPLAAVGRSEVPGRPVAPLPDSSIGDPDLVPVRHAAAYPPEVIGALIDYVADLTDQTGPDIPVFQGGDLVEGGVQFRLQCAACHSWSGQGGALVERTVPALGAATPIQVGEAVRAGPGQMPAFGQAALDDRQLSDLVAYVQDLKKPSDPGGQPLGHLGPVTEGAVALVGLIALLAMCRWIGEREPEAGAEPAGSGGTAEPAGPGGTAEPANSEDTTAAGPGGTTSPAGSGGTTSPAGSGSTTAATGSGGPAQ